MTSGDTRLACALATLGAGLEDITDDLGHRFDQFRSVIRAAVPSYCGLSMTVVTGGIPVTINAPDHHSDDDGSNVAVASSVVIPLPGISVRTSGELVLFAAVPGAFIDLAADLAFVTSTELATFEVDTRLDGRVARPVDVEGFSIIHQAVGYLIAAGSLPEQAHARIAELAQQGGHDLATAAGYIVNGNRG